MIADLNGLGSNLSGLQRIQTELNFESINDLSNTETIFSSLISLKPFQSDIYNANKA
jgi:hypothetical protein